MDSAGEDTLKTKGPKGPSWCDIIANFRGHPEEIKIMDMVGVYTIPVKTFWT
jgi:hypothetical protein